MDPGSKPRPRGSATRLRVTVTDDKGRAVRAPGLAAWLVKVAPARARGDVAIAIVSDARIRALNKQFRRKDKATDVLSFRSGHRARFLATSSSPPASRAGRPGKRAIPMPPS